MSKIETYKDKRGEYRWRLRAGNSKIIAVSGEGFKTKRICSNSVANVIDSFRNVLKVEHIRTKRKK